MWTIDIVSQDEHGEQTEERIQETPDEEPARRLFDRIAATSSVPDQKSTSGCSIWVWIVRRDENDLPEDVEVAPLADEIDEDELGQALAEWTERATTA